MARPLLGPAAGVVTALAAALPAAGAEWSPSRTLSTDGFANEVAVDAAGRVTVAWQPSPKPGNPFPRQPAVMVSETQVGRRWARTIRLAPSGTPPALAVNRAGAAVVAWVERPGGTCQPIFCYGALRAATRPPGGRFGAPRTLEPRVLGTAAAAMGPRGDALVTGVVPTPSDGAMVAGRIAVFSRAGGGWRRELPEGAQVGANVAGAAGLAVGPDGAALVSAARGGNESDGNEIWVLRRVRRRAFGPATRLFSGVSTDLAAHIDARGRELVVGSRAQVVFAVRRGRHGWASQDVGRGGRVSLAAAASGDALLLWRRDASFTARGVEVLGARRLRGGRFSSPVRIFPSGTADQLAVTPPDTRGKAFVAWAAEPSAPRLGVGTLTGLAPPRARQVLSTQGVAPHLAADALGGAALAFSRIADPRTLRTHVMLSTRAPRG